MVDGLSADSDFIAPENLINEEHLPGIESAYWTSDLPRFVHDMVATIRYLREEKGHLETQLEAELKWRRDNDNE